MMQSVLHYNVPRFIAHIAARGGVSADEWEWMRTDTEDINYPMGVIARADEYLLYPKDQDTFDKALFVLILAIAIMSFLPSGIHIFGLHFCSEIENYLAIKDGCSQA